MVKKKDTRFYLHCKNCHISLNYNFTIGYCSDCYSKIILKREKPIDLKAFLDYD